jgi:protein phosphatase
MAAVCDGMGGHEGGEIASLLALTAIQDHMTKILPTPQGVREGLAEAMRQANEAIYQRNVEQNRNRYRKMGTTAVAACIVGAELHVASVGDSRIYLISRRQCQQLTVDDDVMNLELSSGRTTLSSLLGNRSGGALTQALGIIATTSLLPAVQSFVLAEDCLILLCSDGLCDGFLIERKWQTALLPLLDQDIEDRAYTLIDLALQELGHDNITFVLLKYLTEQSQSVPTVPDFFSPP